jgi:hypothetical protein
VAITVHPLFKSMKRKKTRKQRSGALFKIPAANPAPVLSNARKVIMSIVPSEGSGCIDNPEGSGLNAWIFNKDDKMV